MEEFGVQSVLSDFVICLRALTVDRDQDLISHVRQMKQPMRHLTLQPKEAKEKLGAINTDLL